MHIKVTLTPLNDLQNEILTAELAELGYDSFLEIENGLEAYIENTLFEEKNIQNLKEQYQESFEFDYSFEEMPEKNWNETWEADYSPVEISEECRIIAFFHEPKNLPYEILITPKMSFGTGHHDTTVLMAKYLLSLPRPVPKRIIDAGTGTGILAILSEKLGAKEIIAFDIDEWSVINTQENITLNHCQNIKISQDTIQTIKTEGKFDVLIANIQRNVLFDEMEMYSEKLNTEGVLLLSGFYEKDKEYLIERAKEFQLIYQSHQIQNDWCGLCLKKI